MPNSEIRCMPLMCYQSAQEPSACKHSLPVHLLQGLLALTEDQLRDLMLMRQLYLTKRGLLAMERKALVNQMASNEGSMPHPSDNITKMADLATCLKENAAEDHHVHRKVARAVYRGVRHLRCVFVAAPQPMVFPAIPCLQ